MQGVDGFTHLSRGGVQQGREVFVGRDCVENLPKFDAQFLAPSLSSCLVQPQALSIVVAGEPGTLGTWALEVFQALGVIIERMREDAGGDPKVLIYWRLSRTPETLNDA